MAALSSSIIQPSILIVGVTCQCHLSPERVFLNSFLATERTETSEKTLLKISPGTAVAYGASEQIRQVCVLPQRCSMASVWLRLFFTPALDLRNAF
jgi:hypothetical protein